MYKKLLLSLQIFTLVLFVSSFNLTIASEVSEGKNINRAGSGKLREDLLALRCEKLTNQIDKRVTKFESNKSRHAEFYKKVVSNLTNLVSTLNDKGLDTTTLSSHLSVLDGKVSKFSIDYALYISKLNATKGFACGSSQGDFRTSLQAARDALKVVKDDVVDIRNYYLTVVKKDLKDLRDQLKANKSETSENDESGEQD